MNRARVAISGKKGFPCSPMVSWIMFSMPPMITSMKFWRPPGTAFSPLVARTDSRRNRAMISQV